MVLLVLLGLWEDCFGEVLQLSQTQHYSKIALFFFFLITFQNISEVKNYLWKYTISFSHVF